MDKLQIGDRVEIVEYGHIININDECDVTTEDSMPQLIGQIGVIEVIKLGKYGIKGIIGKYFPFCKDQLKKI